MSSSLPIPQALDGAGLLALGEHDRPAQNAHA
jgi:hypothetical protein